MYYFYKIFEHIVAKLLSFVRSLLRFFGKFYFKKMLNLFIVQNKSLNIEIFPIVDINNYF